MSSLAEVSKLQTLSLGTRIPLTCVCNPFGGISTEQLIVTEELTALGTNINSAMIVIVNIPRTCTSFRQITTSISMHN